MFGWPGASQLEPAAFCWGDAPWASSQQPAAGPPSQPAPQALLPSSQAPWGPATTVAGRSTLLGQPRPAAAAPLVQQSRSGVAALSAQRAQQRGRGSADPFTFEEAPSAQPDAVPGGGWRGRGTSFLLSSGGRGGAGGGAASTRPDAHTGGAAAATGPQAQPLPVATAQPQQKQQQQRPAAQRASTRPPPAPARPARVPAMDAAAAAKPAAAPPLPPQAPPPLPAAPPVSISLERYLEFFQLLTKNTGQVQPLSDLEKSILKAADMKQILLINGLNASGRSKKELQERMGGPLQLFSPLCLLPDSSTAAAAAAAAPVPAGGAAAAQLPLQLPALPDADAVAALGWVEPAAASALQGSTGSGSCCTLPQACIRLQGDELVEAAAPAAAAQHQHQPPAGQPAAAAALLIPQQAPADSQATLASFEAAACMQGAIQLSPGVAQQGQPWPAPAAVPSRPAVAQLAGLQGSPCSGTGGELEEEEQEEGGDEDCEGPAAAPEWLVQGIASVAERSQGSSDVVAGKQLLGRRVTFVLLEDFEQADAKGITDTVAAGVLEGQVVEPVGVPHDEECPPGCTQQHAFHYVRVRASASTAPTARRALRRLDLVVDLQEGLRQRQLEGLLGLTDEELQDAWVLLEPRPDSEEEDEAAEGRKEAAPAAAAGNSGWRVKRSTKALAPAAAKRRQR